MAPTDNFHELTDEVRGLRADFRVILTKMFGTPDEKSENPQGRIPRLELQVASHEERIGVLESLKQRAGGAGWLVAAVVGLIEVAYHLLAIARH